MNARLNTPSELFRHQMYCCQILTCLKPPVLGYELFSGNYHIAIKGDPPQANPRVRM